MEIPSIVIIGDESYAGTYILRIRLERDTALRFGRFKKGKLISLLAGEYAYIGSALAEKGSDHVGAAGWFGTQREAAINIHIVSARRCSVDSLKAVWEARIYCLDGAKPCIGTLISFWTCLRRNLWGSSQSAHARDWKIDSPSSWRTIHIRGLSNAA